MPFAEVIGREPGVVDAPSKLSGIGNHSTVNSLVLTEAR